MKPFRSESNKLSLYTDELKNEFRFEPYLRNIKDVDQSVSVTKMRISCHPLPIETGRYKKIPRDQRFCPLCKSYIGDELHCLMECNHPSIASLQRENFLEAFL